MTVKDLERLYDYGYWANRKILHVLAQLEPGQLTQEVVGSYGSIRNVLVHMLSAEWGWLDRSGGLARGPALVADDYPALEFIVETWTSVERSMRELLSKLKDEDLSRAVEFTLPPIGKRSMPLGELLQHAANHGVHHRGQVALLIRSLGHTPGNFDMIIYDAERPRASESS